MDSAIVPGTDNDVAGENDAFVLDPPNPRELCSPQLRIFLKTYKEIFDFFFFGINLATHADRARLTAAKALAGLGREEDIERLADLEQNPDPAFKRLQEFSELQSENMTVRIVNNFTCYLSEIVQSAMIKRPEILKSKEQVKIEDVLRFSNFRDLVAFLVNRKINELSYKNISDFADFISERLGISLTTTDSQKAMLMLAIELRNVITHNRGIISETTVKRLGDYEHGRNVVIGKRYHVEFEDLVEMTNCLLQIARSIDEEFCSKFRIRRTRYGRKTRQVRTQP